MKATDEMAHDMARTIRALIRALGERVPDHWSDLDVLKFAISLLRQER